MNKKYTSIMAFFIVSLALFPSKAFEQNKAIGLWFTEYKNVKSLYSGKN